MTSLRRTAELRSGPFLVLASRRPLLFGLSAGALLLGGLFAPGVLGGVLLILLVLLMGLLSYLSWPALLPSARAVRLATTALVLAAAISKL